jgi:hypothetical protein
MEMNGADPRPEIIVRPFHMWGRWVTALGLLVLAAGCSVPPITIGYQAPIGSLDRLVSGKSSAANVRAALGEPRGHGAARYTKDQPLRKVWFYEFIQMKGTQIGINILLVFFQDDRYDGYLWFSAKELLKRLPS